MSDLSAQPGEPDASGAGALLRAARQKQGLHIAALAASIKVAPSKLEALEAGRYEELPDATFARALAQSVCRVLKIDAQPVLSQLPSTREATLDKVHAGLNTPFRERPGRIDPTDWALWRQPTAWLVLGLLAAATAFMVVPGNWMQRWMPLPARESAETTATQPAVDGQRSAAPSPAAPSVVEVIATQVAEAASTAPSTPEPASAALAAVPPPTPASAVVSAPNAIGARVRAIQDTWVQASDARGQVLISRVVQAGETVDLDGARPLRLRIGNVNGTELQHRGRVVDLVAKAQNNVANVELP